MGGFLNLGQENYVWASFDKSDSDDAISIKRIVRAINHSCERVLDLDDSKLFKISFYQKSEYILIKILSNKENKELFGIYNFLDFIFYPFVQDDNYPYKLVKFLSSCKDDDFQEKIDLIEKWYNDYRIKTSNIFSLSKDDIIYDNFLPVDVLDIEFLESNPHIKKIEEHLIESYSFDWDNFYLYSYKLNFSKKLNLLELIYSKGEKNNIVYFLFNFNWNNPYDFESYLINGSSDVIHNLWAEKPDNFDLSTNQKAFDYLKFFCWAIEGEEGHFVLLEKYSDVSWTDAPDSLNIDFFDRQKPIKNAETDFEKKTGFKKVNVLYGNSIFEAAFNLDTKSGMVEMVDDEPVSNDLTTQTFRFNDFSGKKIEKKQNEVNEIELDEKYYEYKNKKETDLKAKWGNDFNKGKKFKIDTELKKSQTISNWLFDEEFCISLSVDYNSCHEVVFKDCIFEKKVFLSNFNLGLKFENCVFKNGISAVDTQFSKTLTFEDCIFFGLIKEYEWNKEHSVCLNFHNLNCKGDLIFNKSVFFGAVDLSNIDLHGNLEFGGCVAGKYVACDKILKTFTTTLEKKDILLIDDNDIIKTINRYEEYIYDGVNEKLIDVSNSNINGDLIFKGIEIDKELVINNSLYGGIFASGLRVNGITNFYNLFVTDFVDFSNSTFSQSVMFCKKDYIYDSEFEKWVWIQKSIQVKVLGYLNFQNTNINGDLNLSHAKIGSEISLYGAFIDTYLYTFGVVCEETFDLQFSEIRGGFYCYRQGGDLSLLDTKPLWVKKDLDFSSSAINIVRLEAIEVEGNIIANTGNFNEFKISYGLGNSDELNKIVPKQSVVNGYIKLKAIEVKGDLKLSGVLIKNEKEKDLDEFSLKIEASSIWGNLKFFDYNDLIELNKRVKDFEQYVEKGVLNNDKINEVFLYKLKTEIQVGSFKKNKGSLILKNLKVGIKLDLRNLSVKNDIKIEDTSIGYNINMSGFYFFDIPVAKNEERLKKGLDTICENFMINRVNVNGNVEVSGVQTIYIGNDTGNFALKNSTINGGLFFIADKKGEFRDIKENEIIAKIEGDLDVSLSQFKDLCFTKDNFYGEGHIKKDKLINLERAIIDKFRIVIPSPENINLSGIKVNNWDFGKESNKAEDYINVFSIMTEFEKSVYLDVENEMRNKNEDGEANKIYISMRKKMKKEELARKINEKNSKEKLAWHKMIWMIWDCIVSFFTAIFNWLTSYGTRNHDLLLIWISIWFSSGLTFYLLDLQINDKHLSLRASLIYALQNSIPLIDLKITELKIPSTTSDNMILIAIYFRLLSSIVLTLAIFGLASKSSRSK